MIQVAFIKATWIFYAYYMVLNLADKLGLGITYKEFTSCISQ